MNSIGCTIKCLRKAAGVTQDEMAHALGVTYQAVSKWENDTTTPDIALLPAIAKFFGVSIDELFSYKLNVMTDKERFIDYMVKNQILTRSDGGCRIDTERFTTNAQLSKLGEVFADCIRENHLEFDTIVGLAYHGIGFAAATAAALYNKYGVTTQFCFDRKVADSRGRVICGHTPQDGERLVIIDDLLGSGRSADERIARLRGIADIDVEALIVIINRGEETGAKLLAEKYGAKVYSLITDEDIRSAAKRGVVAL